MFFGFAEVLVLAVMTGGTASTDLVDLIHPTHYFAARDMEPSVDKMADMAGEEPKNAKASVLQLTSLRYFSRMKPWLSRNRRAMPSIANRWKQLPRARSAGSDGIRQGIRPARAAQTRQHEAGILANCGPSVRIR